MKSSQFLRNLPISPSIWVLEYWNPISRSTLSPRLVKIIIIYIYIMCIYEIHLHKLLHQEQQTNWPLKRHSCLVGSSPHWPYWGQVPFALHRDTLQAWAAFCSMVLSILSWVSLLLEDGPPAGDDTLREDGSHWPPPDSHADQADHSVRKQSEAEHWIILYILLLYFILFISVYSISLLLS